MTRRQGDKMTEPVLRFSGSLVLGSRFFKGADMDRDLYLHEFLPQPKLSVPITPITRPRFPVIDAHNHLGSDFGGGWSERPVGELLDALDQAGVRVYVDLDGGW